MPRRIHLFGPVLVYDLVRTARRREFVVVRCVFGLSLLVGLFAVWAGRVLKWQPSFWALFSLPPLPANELAELNAQFFLAVMGLQLLAAFLLTPAYAGGAIAREKERQTLAYLLATDLSNREIVLSLLASRLANLLLVFLTGLGVVALLPLLGGVDPNLLLAGYAVLGLTVVSLASLSILSAVQTRGFHEAITRTYLVALGYLALSTSAKLLLPALPWAAAGTWPHLAVQWFCAGNLVTAGRDLHEHVTSGTALGELLPGVLGAYAWFHLPVSAACTGLAVLRLRTAAIEEAARPSREAAGQLPRWFRPRVGSWPMLWKEIFAEPGKRCGRLARLGLGLLVLASFFPAARSFYQWGWEQIPFINWWLLGRYVNDWVRQAGTGLACLMLLQVSVRAAGSLSGERDRQTLDALQTTPLGSSGILAAKWLGSILGPRWAWCWLGSIWLTAYLLGGLDGVAVPRLFATWLAFAGFQAVVGLGFSVAARSTQRATLGTLLTTLVLWGGHWPTWLAFGPLFHWDRHEGHMIRAVQEHGWTPPLALRQLTRKAADLPAGGSDRVWIGVGVWVVGGVILWFWTSRRFRKVLGRSAVPRPHPPQPSQEDRA
jgi:ABC-type transport system involved in multi-copper enzyme maturation permease subunit